MYPLGAPAQPASFPPPPHRSPARYAGEPTESFWLESGQEIELFPREESDEPEFKTTEACRGWVGTMGCRGDGEVDSDEAKHCTEDIDSSMSGFCDCSSGHKATMDCGHDTFTCEEICSVA